MFSETDFLGFSWFCMRICSYDHSGSRSDFDHVKSQTFHDSMSPNDISGELLEADFLDFESGHALMITQEVAETLIM